MGLIGVPTALRLLASHQRMQDKHYYGRDQSKTIRLEKRRTMYLISSRFALQTQIG